MANDLIALIREKKQLIAKTQAELDAAMRELQSEMEAVEVAPPAKPAKRGAAKRKIATIAVEARRRRRPPDSSLAWAEAVVGGEEVHIDEILKRIEQRFHQRVKKATLVGNLARRVKAHDTFYRSAPNTFGLLASKGDKQLKFG